MRQLPGSRAEFEIAAQLMGCFGHILNTDDPLVDVPPNGFPTQSNLDGSDTRNWDQAPVPLRIPLNPNRLFIEQPAPIRGRHEGQA